MTEFRRSSAAVDALEKLVADLVGTAAGAEGSLDDATREKFLEAQKQLSELDPTVVKMRRKCEARAELEAVKAQLLEQLPGTPTDAIKSAQELLEPPRPDEDTEMKDAGEESSKTVVAVPETVKQEIRRLLDHALELDGIATYGAKMVEKVLDLLKRFDAANSQFSAEVLPRFAVAVADAGADAEAKRAAAEREAAELAAEEARRAEEEHRRTVAALMEESEKKLQQQREEEEEERRKLEAEAEAKRKAEEQLAAEEEAFRRAQEEEEKRFAEVGPDSACAEALVGMLAMPVSAYREATEALHGMIASVASEPEDARLRVIRIANEGFQQKLGRRPGVWLFLRGVGFIARPREDLPSGLIAALGGTGAPGERFLWLKEPDMLSDFEAWVAWHARVKSIADVLQALERLAFQRTAHLGRHGLDTAAKEAVSAADVIQRWEARSRG